jgi:hypothetical protein
MQARINSSVSVFFSPLAAYSTWPVSQWIYPVMDWEHGTNLAQVTWKDDFGNG